MDAMMPMMMMMGVMCLCVFLGVGGFLAYNMFLGMPITDPGIGMSMAPWETLSPGSTDSGTPNNGPAPGSTGTASTSERYGSGWDNTKHPVEEVDCPRYIKSITASTDDYQDGGSGGWFSVNSMKVTCDDDSWKIIGAGKAVSWPYSTTCNKGMTGMNVGVIRPGKEGEIGSLHGYCYSSTITKKKKGSKTAGKLSPSSIINNPNNKEITTSTFSCPANQRLKKVIANLGDRVNGMQFVCT